MESWDKHLESFREEDEELRESDQKDKWYGSCFGTPEDRTREQLAAARGPAIMYEIPEELNEKAKNNNADLTDGERALLLSRGDVIGKALANPTLLTIEEAFGILEYPLPDVVRANIRLATKDQLSEPEELHTKIKHAFDNDQLNTIPQDELGLLGMRFTISDDSRYGKCYTGRDTNEMSCLEFTHRPGYRQARDLVLSHRLKFDPKVMKAAMDRYIDMSRGDPRIPGIAQKTLIPPDLDPNAEHVRYDQEDLDVIVDRMTALDQQRDQGKMDVEEFARRNRGLLTSLQALAQKRHKGPHTPGFDTVPKTWPGPMNPPVDNNEFIVLPHMSYPLIHKAINHLYSGAWAWKPLPAAPFRPPPDEPEPVDEQYRPKIIIPAPSWRGGIWPPFTSTEIQSPASLLRRDMWDRLGIEDRGQLLMCWYALSIEKQDEYIAEAEKLRQEAWDYWEKHKDDKEYDEEDKYSEEEVRRYRVQYPIEDRSPEGWSWGRYLPQFY